MNAEQRAKQRQLFEATVVQHLPHLPLGMDEHGDYEAWLAQSLFAIWRACLAANAIDQPADDERERLRDLLRRCLAHVEQYDNLRTEIEAALAKREERG